MSDGWRPRTRADCAQVPRPCPYVSCRYNLYLDVSEGGGLKLRHPTLAPDEIPPTESCALDVADTTDGLECSEIGQILGCTKERVRQIYNGALTKLQSHASPE